MFIPILEPFIKWTSAKLNMKINDFNFFHVKTKVMMKTEFQSVIFKFDEFIHNFFSSHLGKDFLQIYLVPQKLPDDLIEKNGQVRITKLVFYIFFSLLS